MITSELFHRIADTRFTHSERAKLRCQLAKEFEEAGHYEAAREALGELWSRIGEELPHRRQVPVIMLSAGDFEREARRAGASVFLRKPEDTDALAETIARLLARKLKQG